MASPFEWTAADWQSHLGGIPLQRIRMYPRPGMATEKDVLEIHARTGRLCELVDGVLVEKPMGFYESELAAALIFFLGEYLRTHRLGTTAGEAGMLKILPTQVRIPDVSFIRWGRLPDRRAPIPAVAPDLAVEVLSESNTEEEMAQKLRDYFAAGTLLVWYIDPRARSARAYTALEQYVVIDEAGTLSGGDVLPGFELRLKDLFAAVEPPESAAE
jgi:Uma2 family endonuclease